MRKYLIAHFPVKKKGMLSQQRPYNGMNRFARRGSTAVCEKESTPALY
jgi:hypothetical protein